MEICADFSEGFALVKNNEGKYGYIDINFVLKINPFYSQASIFKEGYFAVKEDDTPMEGGSYRMGKWD